MKGRARFRKMACLTQAQIGRRVGKSAGTICLWERGELELSPEDERRIYREINTALRKELESISDLMDNGGLDSVLLESDGNVDLRIGVGAGA